MDIEKIVNRETLKYAVMKRIICPNSGVVLDIRTAVYYSVTTAAGQSGSEVVDGAAWDAIAEETTKKCADNNIKLEVIDGRVINARKPRR